jgi:hypothetical protein|tara:strand:- start:452 stop:673 length:222 start_codon:yes stop_codon:yes gene_type:complete
MTLKLKFVSENKNPFKDILSLIKKVKNKKICYVTLNKTADSLKNSFKKNKIDVNNFYFIDGITMGLKKPKKNS